MLTTVQDCIAIYCNENVSEKCYHSVLCIQNQFIDKKSLLLTSLTSLKIRFLTKFLYFETSSENQLFRVQKLLLTDILQKKR